MKIEYTLPKASKYEIKEDSTYGIYFRSKNNLPIINTTVALYNSSIYYIDEEKIYLQLANANTPELACMFCNNYGSLPPKMPPSEDIFYHLENSKNPELYHDYVLYNHFQFYQLTMYNLLNIFKYLQAPKLSTNDYILLFEHCVNLMTNPFFGDFFELEYYPNAYDKTYLMSELEKYPLIQYMLYLRLYTKPKLSMKNGRICEEPNPNPIFKYQNIHQSFLYATTEIFPKKCFEEFLSAMLSFDLNNISKPLHKYVKRNQHQFLSFAQYVFSEFLVYFIKDATPIVSFDTFDNISSWKFNSLANAIFFYFYMDCSNGNIYKRCDNDYCQKLFACSPAYTRKIYCSPNCAHKVANRKWKQNKKALTNQQK